MKSSSPSSSGVSRRAFLARFVSIGLVASAAVVLPSPLKESLFKRLFSRLRPRIEPPQAALTPARDPRLIHLGWKVYEEKGFAVFNDTSFAGIMVKA